jgi:hypothetical protein
MNQSNHRGYATCVCSERWADMGQASPTHGVLIQQQLSRKHQDVTFWITLWMTLPHTAKLVWVRRMGYIWSWHCGRGRRESKTNPCKHLDYPISLEELHQQEASSLRVWSGWSRVASNLPNERCTSLRHQRKASSPLHRFISHHQQVWSNVLSSGVTVEAIGGT